VALLDPHGQLCEAVLAGVPSHRTNDVVLFDAADTEFPIAFNMLDCPDPAARPLAASGVIAAFKKIWPEFFGPRMEHYFRSALLALLEVPGTSLLSLQRFLSDARYREGVTARVTDPVVQSVWRQEYPSLAPKLQAEAVAPILNKVGQFLSNPLLRNIVGQARSTLDLRKVMDEGRVLLVNLSKGRVGEDASALLGSFLVTAIHLAAMSRADIAEGQRRPFYFHADEFQNFASVSFATALAESRKFGLALTIATQYLAQVPEEILAALFGNVGSLISFQVGVQDGEVIAAELGGDLTPRDLLALPRFQAYCRLLIDGHPSRPFSLRTLPPSARFDHVRPHIIRRYSRQRYGRPIAEVERQIKQVVAAG
jgi:hypothetical protein